MIIGFQVIAAIEASYLDYRYPFSNAGRVAGYLEREKLTENVIVGYRDYSNSAVSGYLKQKQFYYPESGRYGSFVRWDNHREPVSQQYIVAQAIVQREAKNRSVIIILIEPLDPALVIAQNLKPLARFTGSVVGDEDYFLYLLK
ncbi:MAG: hypothetical protein HGB22_01160 [Chlorobiaceae bacterium]|nr:hypothetical protein [Chlorobiaceae bacterium]